MCVCAGAFSSVYVTTEKELEVSPPVSSMAIYDNAQEILAVGAVNPQAMSLQQCVAYEHLPYQNS